MADKKKAEPLATHIVIARFSRGQRVVGFCGADSGKPKVGTVAEIKIVFGEGGPPLLRYGVAYWPDYGTEVRRVEVPENLLSLPEGDQGDAALAFTVTITEPEPVVA